MDEFTPSQVTTPPFEQSPLMNSRDPNALARNWGRSAPLHGLSQRSRSSQSQGRARLARLDKLQPVVARDMFPFRVFNQPILYQGSPTWADANGAANYRTFSVWTGNAIGFVPLFDSSWSGGWILSPETVQVARTAGYNFKIPTANESYNEAYSQQSVGLYNGPYSPTSTEIMFTAPPCSFAAFWITYDANVTVNGVEMPVWPVLHFGGISYGGVYFGDANAINFLTTSPAIDGGIPYCPDLIALAQTSPFPTSFPAILVALIQVGLQGSVANTGNDGTAWIIQCLHDHVQKAFSPSYRGDYNATTIYFPGDAVHFPDNNGFDLVAQNSSQYGISQIPITLYPYPYFGTNTPIVSGGFSVSPWSALGTPYYNAVQYEPENLDVTMDTQPSNQDVALGVTAQISFQFSMTSTAATNGVSVQWYIKPPGLGDEAATPIVDSTVYAGTGTCSPNYAFFNTANTQTVALNISNTTGMGGFTFYATVTEGTEADVPPYPLPYTTDVVTLATIPMCVVGPQDTDVTTGDPALFWCVGDKGTGDPLTYQWQISTDGGTTWTNVTNGAVYSGVTTPQLFIISTATLANLDQFRCQLTSFMATVPTPAGILGLS